MAKVRWMERWRVEVKTPKKAVYNWKQEKAMAMRKVIL